MKAKDSPVALRARETLYMQWLGSGTGVKGWKNSMCTRCVGYLTLGSRSLMMFQGGVNRKRICGTQKSN
jgi:hypothetical protein